MTPLLAPILFLVALQDAEARVQKLDAFVEKWRAAKKADTANDWYGLCRWVDEEMGGAFEEKPAASPKSKPKDFYGKMEQDLEEIAERMRRARSAQKESMSLAKFLQEYDEARTKGRLKELAARVHEGTVRGFARAALERVLEKDPNHELARRKLGYQLHNGVWRTEEEIMREKGFVRFEGAWRTPKQVDAVLEQRRADRAAEDSRRLDESLERLREEERRLDSRRESDRREHEERLRRLRDEERRLDERRRDCVRCGRRPCRCD